MDSRAVLDANIVVKLLLEEVDSNKAHALMTSWGANEIVPVAPYLLAFELVNVLYRHVVGGRLTLEQSVELSNQFWESGIELMDLPHLSVTAIELATRLKQPAVCDAHYLALAVMLDCELWTADARFFSAARGQFHQVHLLSEIA